ARIDLQLERLDAYVRDRFAYYVDAGATIGPESPLRFDIDIVGFSRGAAAARHFANRVLRRRDNGYYRELVDGGCVSIEIRFLGLFDTVLSTHVGDLELGIPEAVGYVASLVAANEHRRAFPLESIFASADERGFASNRVEVSLLGAHGDIGGGYACIDLAACDGGDLSDIALAWMREQAAAQGVSFAPLPPEHRRIDVPVLHDESASFPFFDSDPVADREVRYHAASRTPPLAETCHVRKRRHPSPVANRSPKAWAPSARSSSSGPTRWRGRAAWARSTSLPMPDGFARNSASSSRPVATPRPSPAPAKTRPASTTCRRPPRPSSFLEPTMRRHSRNMPLHAIAGPAIVHACLGGVPAAAAGAAPDAAAREPPCSVVAEPPCAPRDGPGPPVGDRASYATWNADGDRWVYGVELRDV